MFRLIQLVSDLQDAGEESDLDTLIRTNGADGALQNAYWQAALIVAGTAFLAIILCFTMCCCGGRGKRRKGEENRKHHFPSMVLYACTLLFTTCALFFVIQLFAFKISILLNFFSIIHAFFALVLNLMDLAVIRCLVIFVQCRMQYIFPERPEDAGKWLYRTNKTLAYLLSAFMFGLVVASFVGWGLDAFALDQLTIVAFSPMCYLNLAVAGLLLLTLLWLTGVTIWLMVHAKRDTMLRIFFYAVLPPLLARGIYRVTILGIVGVAGPRKLNWSMITWIMERFDAVFAYFVVLLALLALHIITRRSDWEHEVPEQMVEENPLPLEGTFIHTVYVPGQQQQYLQPQQHQHQQQPQQYGQYGQYPGNQQQQQQRGYGQYPGNPQYFVK